jgi:hypothetical protein
MSAYINTLRHRPQDNNLNNHPRENLETHVVHIAML